TSHFSRAQERRLSTVSSLSPARSRETGRKRLRESSEDSSRVRDGSSASTVRPSSANEGKMSGDEE
ncbi:hypothetical protein Pmar_PMAR006249, partial [Perkinsus marinus ATCC 50983]